MNNTSAVNGWVARSRTANVPTLLKFPGKLRASHLGPGVIALGALALVGCAGSPEPAPVTEAGAIAAAAASPEYESAQALLSQGRYGEAAAAFSALAGAAQGNQRALLELDAAQAFLAAGDVANASAMMSGQPTLAPGSALSDRRALVMAEIALIEQRPGDALALLPQNPAPDTDLRTRLGIADARARANDTLGNAIGSATARAELDTLLIHPNAVNELPVRLNTSMLEIGYDAMTAQNRAALWEGLRSASLEELAAARGAPPENVAGWIELAENTRPVITDTGALNSAISFWQQRYPGHPANAEIIPAMLDVAARAGTPPTFIAVLLPLDGPFKEAGAAVQDGFMTAWNAAPNGARPRVEVLDTSANAIVPLYRSAVESGADFVVGPLRKQAVNTLVASGAVSVPTLVLNEPATPLPGENGVETQGGEAGADATAQDSTSTQNPGLGSDASETIGAGASVFTFTLAPDAESRRVAEYAFDEGYRGAAVLAPDGGWGDRMTSAFTQRWEEIGGTVVAEQRYDASGADFATPVKTLLQVQSSERRAKEMRSVVRGYFAFQPSYRQDMDFIFMPAFPVEARSLKPHLSYFAASRVPVLATSHVYTGQPSPGEDLDLDRIRFGDMPFILTPTPAERAKLGAVASSYGGSPADYGRLLAFGTDAYELGMRVQALSVAPEATYEGRSGVLSVGPGNQVRRGLTWATFAGGTPLVDGQIRPDPAITTRPATTTTPTTTQ